MATITHFAEKLLEHNEIEPESIRMFRKIAESEDIRILLGDFFLKLAASEPQDKEKPHEDLLRRMIGARTPACESQLENLAKNLDLLRQYDLGKEAQSRFRKLRQTTTNAPDKQQTEFANKNKPNIAKTSENV